MSYNHSMKKYVLTGGPGIGKTTVIELLASRGFAILPEVARMVTEEERLKGSVVLPWLDLEKYQEKVVDRQLELEEKISADTIFLDRGIIDGYAYCKLGNVRVPKKLMENAPDRYHKIFLLEPLPFYSNDKTRFEDRDEAKKIHDSIIDAYREFGYEVILVPVLPPEKRADFIISKID